MYDVLVFIQDGQEHDVGLKAVLQHLASAGVMLNPSECEFSRSLPIEECYAQIKKEALATTWASEKFSL